jgi:tetratricopeptide (TPR) repeat protein
MHGSDFDAHDFDAHDDEAYGAGPCASFQVDLSCLLDGELDESAAGRAMVHMEACELCRGFVEDARAHMRLHRELHDEKRLFARLSTLVGGDWAREAAKAAESVDLVHSLATIFYRLGKAYVTAAIDPGFRERIFEAVVPIAVTQVEGRGFVDGVLRGGRAGTTRELSQSTRLDWNRARSMLNGRLERLESPFEKGRRLLEEALACDASHEEAQLWLAFLHAHEGKRLVAAEEYRRVFDTAVLDANRGHAMVQLGRLHSTEENWRAAIACWRWVTISGLADADDRFWVARFNLGMVHALTGNQARSLSYFRALLDRHPARSAEVAQMFARSPKLRAAIDERPGFPEALVSTCPELFAADHHDAP